MRWLVTGGKGMLAQEFSHLISPEDLRAPSRIELDIRDPDGVDAAVAEADVVVNAAAYTAVDAAESDEGAAFSVNAEGAGVLARAAWRHGTRLVQISTDYVFDGTARSPYDEAAPLTPVCAYGRSKAEGERRVRQENPEGSIVVRTSWLYGGHGRHFASAIADRLHASGGVEVVDDQMGQPTWARDVAASILSLVSADVGSGTFHSTAAGSTTWFGFACAIAERLGYDRSVVSPVSSARFAGKAERPTYSVLGHAAWVRCGLPQPRHWTEMLDDAIPHLNLHHAALRNGER